MIKKYRFSLLLALVILVLSLAAPSAFKKADFIDMTFTDKIVHMGMYFALMSVITWESRIVLEKASIIFIAGLVSFLYGILMELFQEIFTVNRTGSIWDALFNTIGIILSIAMWQVIRNYLKKKSLR